MKESDGHQQPKKDPFDSLVLIHVECIHDSIKSGTATPTIIT